MTVRPFAYNPQTSPAEVIPGTVQFGDLAIGVDEQEYSADPGGVTWFMGPDEDLGWVICSPVPNGNHPTPSGSVGTVRFWRSKTKDDEGFVKLANYVSSKKNLGITFPNPTQALQKLSEVGLWTNYTITSNGSVFYQIWNDAEIWEDSDIWAD
jgi:hypothetical protein